MCRLKGMVTVGGEINGKIVAMESRRKDVKKDRFPTFS